MEPKSIRTRYNSLKQQRSGIESVWDLVNRYVFPYRGDIYGNTSADENAVDWRANRQIFDSTAVNAANILASSMHSSLTSSAYRWFELMFRNPNINKDQEARKWLQDASSKCHLALQDSNFDLESNELYLDLTGYGSGFIVEEEIADSNNRYRELSFECVPVDDCVAELDHRGRIEIFYRRYFWTPLQIITKFGDDKVPQKIKDLHEKDPVSSDKIEVIMCVYPRPNKAKNKNSFKKLAPKNRPYGVKYVMQETGEQMGDEHGYYEMPAFMPRWRRTSKSMWGHSPAMVAMPDILTLNQLVEMTLTAADKAIDPVTKVTERGLLSDLDMSGDRVVVVRSMDDIGTHESAARFDVSELQKAGLQESINKIFYVDQLQLKDSPQMSATESNIRYELMQRLLGPTAGRLRSDYLDPMVQRTFNILLRAGVIPPPPAIAASEDADNELDIVYTGPLIRAQRTDLVMGVSRWVATLSELSQVEPSVLDVPNFDNIATELAILEGVPATMLNSEKEITTRRKGRKQMESQMAQAQLAEQMGKGAKAVGEAAAVTPPQQGEMSESPDTAEVA